MMRIVLFQAVATITFASTASATEPPVTRSVPSIADFKLRIEFLGPGKTPFARAELVIREGVAYQFVTEMPDEVLIIDQGQSRITIFDLKRKLQTELNASRIDNGLRDARAAMESKIRLQEKSGTRGDLILAGMYRDLIDPKLKETFDPATHELRLNNGSVDIQAKTEPDSDKARLAFIYDCFAAIAKLGAYRDPEGLPPYTRLDAYRAIAAHLELRPTEISFIYRLTGPPRKLRWNYQLVPTLTEREVTAIGLVNRLRSTTKFVPYEAYEKDEEE